MKNLCWLVGLWIGLVPLRSAEGAVVFSYTVASSNLGGTGTADGKIFADAQEIGTWTLSGFTLTGTATYSMSTFTAAQNTAYSYNLPGIGITMLSSSNYGFGYSVTASINSSFRADYFISGVTILSRSPNVGTFNGPIGTAGSFSAQGKGSLTFSGFSGTATLLDPNDNLAAADGLTFTGTTDIGGYKVSPNGTANAWMPSQLAWKLSSDAGASMTYAVAYNSSDSNQNVLNESTAFTFNLNAVPEPSAFSLLVMGAGALIVFRRRRKDVSF